MEIEVRVPTIFQKVTGGSKVVKASGRTVGELLENLDAAFPGFKGQLTDQDGAFHRFINVYLNGEDIRYLDQLDTSLAAGDVVTILPAIAGGATGRLALPTWDGRSNHGCSA